MKRLLIVPLFLISLISSATTYYLSPAGSDASGNGSIGSPWFTLNKAWSNVTAGDIIYMRGGNYYYTSPQNISGKSGTSTNLIQILAYPGERPIINGRDMDTQHNWDLVGISNANYLYFKGIRISNLPQPVVIPNSNGYYGISMGNYDPNTAVWVTNITFEQVEIDHIGGWGCTIFEHCTDITWLNCDSHHNQDPYSSRFGGDNYGGSDGWESGAVTSTRIHFIGCRAWWNSDDGWDNRYASGVFTYDHCWSFRNGYIPNTYTDAGNGEGFKLQGPNANSANTNNVIRVVQNCLSFDNVAGYEGVPEPYYGGIQLYNNVAYRCRGVGLNFQNASATTTVLRNNIVYKNASQYYLSSNFAHDHNSFDIPITVTDASFQSVDTTGVTGPRQSDGSLPNLAFLRLKTGSPLIDAGINVGIAFAGIAPDLGAFESSTSSTPVSPVYLSSSVENTTSSTLTMSYDQTLANIVPAATSFTVKVNTVARTVNSVAVSGTKVTLAMASPVVNGDAVTVAYTKPSSNPLQTAAGGQAATLAAQNVTNNVAAVALPAYVSSVIQAATPTSLDITYSLSLANIVPATSAFSVMVNSVARQVSSVTISGSVVYLKLASAVANGDVVTVAYTKPSTNPLQTSGGAQAASVGAQSVTNLVAPAKDSGAPNITMTISSNPVHHIVNIALKYITSALSPEIIRILDMSGKMYVQKQITTGATSVKMAVNLKSGVYSVLLLSGGFQVASQKIIVY